MEYPTGLTLTSQPALGYMQPSTATRIRGRIIKSMEFLLLDLLSCDCCIFSVSCTYVQLHGSRLEIYIHTYMHVRTFTLLASSNTLCEVTSDLVFCL